MNLLCSNKFPKEHNSSNGSHQFVKGNFPLLKLVEIQENLKRNLIIENIDLYVLLINLLLQDFQNYNSEFPRFNKKPTLEISLYLDSRAIFEFKNLEQIKQTINLIPIFKFGPARKVLKSISSLGSSSLTDILSI